VKPLKSGRVKTYSRLLASKSGGAFALPALQLVPPLNVWRKLLFPPSIRRGLGCVANSFGPTHEIRTEQRRYFRFSRIRSTARLTNNIHSSRKLKVTWLILGRSHTRSSFQLQPQILAQKSIWCARWILLGMESDARSTMCPGQNMTPTFPSRSVTEPSCTGGYVFISVSSFVCLLASRIIQKLLHRFSQKKISGKSAHGPMKKR